MTFLLVLSLLVTPSVGHSASTSTVVGLLFRMDPHMSRQIAILTEALGGTIGNRTLEGAFARMGRVMGLAVVVSLKVERTTGPAAAEPLFFVVVVEGDRSDCWRSSSSSHWSGNRGRGGSCALLRLGLGTRRRQ